MKLGEKGVFSFQDMKFVHVLVSFFFFVFFTPLKWVMSGKLKNEKDSSLKPEAGSQPPPENLSGGESGFSGIGYNTHQIDVLLILKNLSFSI